MTMTRFDRVAELKRLNITQKSIAEELGYKFVSAVNNVLHERTKTKKARSAIARKMGRPYDEVWPMDNYTTAKNLAEKSSVVNGRP